MRKFWKSKYRVLSLVSLVFLSQCCCCILPVGWQVRQNQPEFRQVIERIDTSLSTIGIDMEEVSAIFDR